MLDIIHKTFIVDKGTTNDFKLSEDSKDVKIVIDDFYQIIFNFDKFVNDNKTSFLDSIVIIDLSDSNKNEYLNTMLNTYTKAYDLHINFMVLGKTNQSENDDDIELDLEIKPEDDAMLVLVKNLYKGYTRREFRKLFDSDLEANNMRRAIEDAPNGIISINRFEILLNKLGLKYKVYTGYETVSRSSSEEHIEIEEKPKKKYKRHNRNNDPYCKQGHISSRFISSVAQSKF